MYFDELDLNDNVLDALYDMRFDTCTPVQEKCIPEILEGHDVLGVAQTGTGKTAAYLLPVLSKLDDGGYPKDAINCVIMSPTRELAQQIDQAMQGFGYYLQGVSSVAVYGGNDGNRYDQELRSLRMGADVVIALGMSYALQLGRHFSADEFQAMVYASVDDLDSYLEGGVKQCPDGSALELKNYRGRMGTGSIDAWQMLMQVEGVPSIIVECGKDCRVSLRDYFGGGFESISFKGVEVDPVYESALGLVSASVDGGYLSIRCNRKGSGKIRVKAIAGGTFAGGPGGTGGSEIEREISILSRGVRGWNNGWL